MKRTLCLLLAFVLGMSCLAGCSASNPDPTPSAIPSTAPSAPEGQPDSSPAGTGEFDPSTAGDVTLRFAWWGSDARHEATLAAIDRYTELYPNVKIEGEYQGYDGFQQKLMTQFTGSSEPDLMQWDFKWNPEWAGKEDLFVDMTKSDLVNMSGFQQSAIDNFLTINGRVIGLPMNSSGFGIMINKKFFEKHDLDVDTVWTWEDMIEVGRKIHESNPNDYLFAIESGTSTGGIGPFVMSQYIYSKYGHYWSGADGNIQATKEELTQAFTILRDLFESGTAQTLGEASLFTGQMEQNPKWINAEMGFTVDWTATVGKYMSSLAEGDFAVGKPPFAKDGANQNIPYEAGMALCVSSRSKNVDVAVHFANWLLTDPEAALLLGTQRSVPNNSYAMQALVDDNQVSPEISQMMDWVNAAPAEPIPLIQSNSEVADVVKNICEEVVYGQLTPEAAADKFLTDVQAKLDAVNN